MAEAKVCRYDPDELYECAICGHVIEHAGWDPRHVSGDVARDLPGTGGACLFSAHASCSPAAFYEDLRRHVAAA